MENTQVMKVSVALSPTEIKIVERLEKKMGLNFSSALRIIVREWSEAKKNGNGAHWVGDRPVAVGDQPSAGASTSAEVKA